ncbi:hypothetical protein [Bradyrhizobium sp. USDA 4486]
MTRLDTLVACVLVGMAHLDCAWADDATDRLKACAQFQGMEHMTCVDQRIGAVAPERLVQLAPQTPNWIVSETTSPVDYKPQIGARTTARSGSKDAPSSLAIHCHANRTALLLSAASPWTQTPSSEIRVVFQINDQAAVDQRWKVADGGRSLVFPGDAARLIGAMPAAGRLLVKVYTGAAPVSENEFELVGLEAVRRRFAEVCGRPAS